MFAKLFFLLTINFGELLCSAFFEICTAFHLPNAHSPWVVVVGVLWGTSVIFPK